MEWLQGSDRGDLCAAGVYALGAALYFVLVQLAGLTFQATPLIFGGTLLVASVFRPRVLAAALLLLCWGVAVALLNAGALPEARTGAAYMVAFGVAAAVMMLLRRWIAPPVALQSAAAVLLAGGLALYGAFDVDALGRGWLWTLVVLADAACLAAASLYRSRRRRTSVAAGPQTQKPAAAP